jgi:hypothetical protein
MFNHFLSLLSFDESIQSRIQSEIQAFINCVFIINGDTICKKCKHNTK